ncbi:hypothetical protein LDENG_00072050 [Lucifuga dentata]|nr:hypothetical protein LDENG_00072050 [Lucifuga dentata]
MALQEWTDIFQIKAKALKQEDCWRLEFDESIVPGRPNHGWKQCNRSASARFRCSKCGRGWSSNRVMVFFHMRLFNAQGIVKVRRFRQDCKQCNEAMMEVPSFSSQNIGILLEHLVDKIRMKCYYEDLQKPKRHFRSAKVQGPHEPAHCEACVQGICPRI